MSDEQKPNVVPIERAKKPKAEIKAELKDIEKQLLVYRAMMGDLEASFLPKFPRRFFVIQDQAGAMRYVEAGDDDVCHWVIENKIKNEIHHYVNRVIPASKSFSIDQITTSDKGVEEILRKWRADPRSHIAQPPAVRQKSDPGLTFSRLPFDFVTQEDFSRCPVSEKLLKRLGGDNFDALTCWIGSIFDPNADTQQYVWIYGEGGNGKSTLGWLIEKVLGHAYISTYAPSERGSPFWEDSLLGKRLVVFPDCDNFEFVTTGRFKSLTGGDQVKIEGKHKQAYSGRLDVKCLFFSNERPNIAGTAANLRRVIFCTSSPLSDADRVVGFRDLLWAEAPYFFGSCVAKYQRCCVSGGPIAVSLGETTELVASNEEWAEALFYVNFEVSPTSKITSAQLREALLEARLDNFRLGDFVRWMACNHGVRRKRIVNGKQKVTVYEGVKLLDETEKKKRKGEFVCNEAEMAKHDGLQMESRGQCPDKGWP